MGWLILERLNQDVMGIIKSLCTKTEWMVFCIALGSEHAQKEFFSLPTAYVISCGGCDAAKHYGITHTRCTPEWSLLATLDRERPVADRVKQAFDSLVDGLKWKKHCGVSREAFCDFCFEDMIDMIELVGSIEYLSFYRQQARLVYNSFCIAFTVGILRFKEKEQRAIEFLFTYSKLHVQYHSTSKSLGLIKKLSFVPCSVSEYTAEQTRKGPSTIRHIYDSIVAKDIVMPWILKNE